MIYFNRSAKRVVLRYYLCYTDGFVIEWRQSVNNKEEIVGIGCLNQHKNIYRNRYKKKGYCGAMYRRIAELSKNRCKE